MLYSGIPPRSLQFYDFFYLKKGNSIFFLYFFTDFSIYVERLLIFRLLTFLVKIQKKILVVLANSLIKITGKNIFDDKKQFGKFIQNKCRRPELYSLWGEGEFVNRISARLRAMSAWTEGGGGKKDFLAILSRMKKKKSCE